MIWKSGKRTKQKWATACANEQVKKVQRMNYGTAFRLIGMILNGVECICSFANIARYIVPITFYSNCCFFLFFRLILRVLAARIGMSKGKPTHECQHTCQHRRKLTTEMSNPKFTFSNRFGNTEVPSAMSRCAQNGRLANVRTQSAQIDT